MNLTNNRPSPGANQRRSQRILLSLPIQVSGERANGSAFTESTHTIVVNAHGALIKLREAVIAGQKLRMKNMATNEELICRVVDINQGQNAHREIGLEFNEPCPRFWRVAFPPADWSPRNPEAKRFVSRDEPIGTPMMKR